MMYYGQETQHAIENFPFSYNPVQKELIYAIVEIKKAAAAANREDGGISAEMCDAILQSCDEILSGTYDDQFVTCAIQGGAGTSIHMNVNEVIASLATEKLQGTIRVHPLDHVNRSQSTNDVNPSALKIVAIRLLKSLIDAVNILEQSFLAKANEFHRVYKLGRTHLQDAVPTTLGAEFRAYAALCARHVRHFTNVFPFLYELNLGGTAIGNCINASETYRHHVYKTLREITGFPFAPADNLMAQTSSQTDFLAVMNALTTYLTDLSKIANDIRLMASGPKGGFAELKIPELQKGSTIMPGKVNPVIPEVVNQIYYWVAGQAVTVQMAARAAQFELANMFPVVADCLILSIRLTKEATFIFAKKCIDVIQANEEQCKKHLEESTAYATILTPKLGYDVASSIVKESVQTNRTIREIVVARKLLSEEEFDAIIQSQPL
ncbi:MAG: aspartate ammonia-lyase [Patescibacteria group bacterium]|nr:aspartate ammonia-lyase [Patescibacteria group bacterium]